MRFRRKRHNTAAHAREAEQFRREVDKGLPARDEPIPYGSVGYTAGLPPGPVLSSRRSRARHR